MSTIQTDTILLFSHVSKIYSNTALDLKASLCGLQDQCHSVDDGIWFGSWATFIDTVHTYVSRLIHHGEYLKERYDFAEIGARQLYRVRYMIEKFKDEFETGYIAQPEAVQYLLCRWRLHKIREYRTKLSVIVASALQNLKVKASIEDDRHIVAINNTLRSRLGDDERSIHRSIYEVKGQLYSIFRPPSRDEEIPKIIRKLKQVLELEIANGASGSCIHEGARYLIDLYKRSLDTQPTHTPSTWSIPEENLVSKRGVAKHVLGDETWTIMKARYFGTGVILLQKDDLSPVELNRFRVSVSKWINLRHPAIESLIGVCNDGPNVALVKSLYRQPLARTLKQYRTNLRQDRCLPLRMRWIHEVATGMAYIHKHGLVHGDLRLENIVNDRYCVQITVNSCIHRDIQGRPVQRDGVSYAPELRRRFPAEPTMATDVYAFGILMCYLIYCRPPEVLQHIEKMTQPVDGIPAEVSSVKPKFYSRSKA
ncbi:kinase-like domain-containing protein [Polychytrium aggregatum]|uniref:kinase-like domain-containing protein n=1 Tax=Polychytrium aggregatum TaxID=110093 RepID=UPI0022FDF478|nr:kinase-like domain-containing protein [Polychytrium aggregatum]KAI9190651.1 kinase-like domain-containing protein [Polychytrium aggregatum]